MRCYTFEERRKRQNQQRKEETRPNKEEGAKRTEQTHHPTTTHTAGGSGWASCCAHKCEQQQNVPCKEQGRTKSGRVQPGKSRSQWGRALDASALLINACEYIHTTLIRFAQGIAIVREEDKRKRSRATPRGQQTSTSRAQGATGIKPDNHNGSMCVVHSPTTATGTPTTCMGRPKCLVRA